MAIAPEVAAEYASLTEGGAAAGRDTLQTAERNVSARQAARQAAASANKSRQSAPSSGSAPDPLQAAQAAFHRVRQSAGGTYQHVSTPGRTAQTITKLIWAIALGLIALQIAAEATGQQWSFSLPGKGNKPSKEPYQPLYAGQPAAAMPWMPLSVVNSGQRTPGATSGGGVLVAP